MISNDLFAALPEELQQAIKPVLKTSDTGFYYPSLNQTIEKLWIPSDVELNSFVSGEAIRGQGEPYAIFTTNESRVRTSNGAAAPYWTRSSGIKSMHYFRYVDTNGNLNSAHASGQMNILFGFCL
jgi:hypothetical protein